MVWVQIGPQITNNPAPNYDTSVIPPAASGVGMNPAGGSPLAYMIFMYFDLSAYAAPGQIFSGDVKIRMGMNWGENGPLPFRLFSVVSNCA